jgi:hypothetical protein
MITITDDRPIGWYLRDERNGYVWHMYYSSRRVLLLNWLCKAFNDWD